MTNGISLLKRGTYMRWTGKTWIVKRVLPLIIHLKDTQTGEYAQLPVAQWDAECRAQTLEHIPEPGSNLDEPTRALLSVPVTDLPETMKATVLRKFEYVQAFLHPEDFYELRRPDVPLAERVLDPRCSARSLGPLLAHVAEARGDKLPPGCSTLCKWLALFAAGGEDPRVLASKYHLRGSRVCFMDPDLEELLNDTIDTAYLRMHGPPKRAVYLALGRKVVEWNEKRPDDKLVMLTERHVARYITEKVDQHTAVARRRGKQAADRLFKPVGLGPVPDHILDVVEIDHTPVDIEVVDDATGLPLGRPTATVLLDRHSRMILACHIHFDGPCTTAVLQAMRQAILPKDFLREICPEFKTSYPGHGLMSCLLSDHGAELTGSYYREACVDLDIRQEFAPVMKPEDKGKIERFLKRLQKEVSHFLPGARPSIGDKNGAEARKTEGTITFSELNARTWRWIVGVYSRRYHRGLGDTPLRVWEKSAAARHLRAPLPTERLNALLSRVEERPVHRTGIEWKQLRYNGPVLEHIRTQPGFDSRKTKVRIRINDHDLSEVLVTDPYTRQSVAVKSTLPIYTKDMTYYKHMLVLALARERFAETLNDEVLLASEKLLDEEQEELWQRSGPKRRKDLSAKARLDGIGSRGLGIVPVEEVDASFALPSEPGLPFRASAQEQPQTSTTDNPLPEVIVRRPKRIEISTVRKK